MGQTVIKLICDECGKDYERTVAEHNAGTRRAYKNLFCSRVCSGKFNTRINTITKPCSNCKKLTTRRSGELKGNKTGNIFCDHTCAAHFNNKFRKKSRRSKIEIALYDLLVKTYPQLSITPNDKTMLEGLEVDIAIPSLKLAIEWNGIVHFKPIYGKEKLAKIQEKDRIKQQIAVLNNINLIVIPDLVSNKKKLDEAFENICNIINDLIGPPGIEPGT